MISVPIIKTKLLYYYCFLEKDRPYAEHLGKGIINIRNLKTYGNDN